MSISSQSSRALLSGLYLFSIQKAGTGFFLVCNMQMPEQVPLRKGQTTAERSAPQVINTDKEKCLPVIQETQGYGSVNNHPRVTRQY